MTTIKTWQQRCEEHPDHQGVVTEQMVRYRMQEEIDELREVFANLHDWIEAYPLQVFPEPDFSKAHTLLQAGGMTLDAISASNMRYVLNGVAEIIGEPS